MLSTLPPRGREASAQEVAARATDAAVRAADAAIAAADAAIRAADAAVRLIDEHDGQVIMLQPVAAPAPGKGPDTELGRPRSGRAWRSLARALIVLGALVLIEAGVTLIWQEPVSALYAKIRQDHLSGALAKVERTVPTPLERRALVALPEERARIEFLAHTLRHTAADGSPVARIRIPQIGVSFVVIKGTSTSDLRSGPGVFPETAFPGGGPTTAIAGHRTTYLAPFRNIDQLHAGNQILLDMPYAHFTYTVIGQRVVAPTDVQAAVANVGYRRLVLSACTPLFSAEKRLLVFARLTKTVPVGAGLLPGLPPPGAGAHGSPLTRPFGLSPH